MAVPAGASPIQSVVLQLSRDLQHAFSKAKTSLSAVATQNRAAHTGSDSALPTSRKEETLIESAQSSGSEISPSSSLIAALDVARTSSLAKSSDAGEESSAQLEESGIRGCEISAASKSTFVSITKLSKQPALSFEKTGTATPAPLISRRGKLFSDGKCELQENDGSEKNYTCNANRRATTQVRCLVSTTTATPYSASSSGASAKDSTPIPAASCAFPKKQKNTPKDDHKSVARWLHLASPAASSSAPLLAPRLSRGNCSASLSSSSLPCNIERASGIQRSSPLLDHAMSASCAGDVQDAAALSYRRAAAAPSTHSTPPPAGMTESRQQFQRKKLISPHVCCSIGSSPCGGPPLFSSSLFRFPASQEQDCAEKCMLPSEKKKEEHVSAKKFTNSYKSRSSNHCSVACAANSRLAEVENRWFFVDILGNAPTFTEETPSQQHRLSAMALGADSESAAQQKMGAQPPGKDGNSCGFFRIKEMKSTSGSTESAVESSAVLLPRVGAADNNSGGEEENVSVVASTVLSEFVEKSSASESEPATASSSASSLRKKGKKGECCAYEEGGTISPQIPDGQQPKETYLSQQPEEGQKQQQGGQQQQQRTQQQQGVKQEEVQKQGVCQQQTAVGVQQRMEDQRGTARERSAAQQESFGFVPALGPSLEKMNFLSLGGQLLQANRALSSSCSFTAAAVAADADLLACSSSAPSSSVTSHTDRRGEQHHEEAQQSQRHFLLQLCEHQQHQLQLTQRQERNEVVASTRAVETGVALLPPAMTSLSSETGSSSSRDVGGGERRRHRMQKDDGSTSFASLEAMVEFIRSSTSLYGTTALEGVTFHVPAEDAEALVAALEEGLPYSWVDIRSAAIEALKPLTALVVGRFVLVQLPSLLLNLAGGAAAEGAAAAAGVGAAAGNAAAAATAAAAAATAEASSLSAVLAIAPWLIVFGGCVYAIIRGAQALQASRRSQFTIYAEEGVNPSLLLHDQHTQDAAVALVQSSPGAAVAQSAATTAERSEAAFTQLLAAAAPAPTSLLPLFTAMKAAVTLLQSPADVAHSKAAARLRGAAERSIMGGADLARAASDVGHHEQGEEQGLFQTTAAEEKECKQKRDTREGSYDRHTGPLIWSCSSSKSGGSSSSRSRSGSRSGRITRSSGSRSGRSRRSSGSVRDSDSRRSNSSESRSSGNVLDLSDVTGSRRNHQKKKGMTCVSQERMQRSSDEGMYTERDELLLESFGSGMRQDASSGDAGSNSTRVRNSSLSKTRDERSSDELLSSKDGTDTRWTEIGGRRGDIESRARGDDGATPQLAAEKSAALALDPRRRIQEEEALMQQMLFCSSADWVKKSFPLDV